MHGSRIRYVKFGRGFKSLRTFDGYSVELYPEVKQFAILKADTGALAAAGTSNGGLHKLKIAAKKYLEELGVKFSEEKRKERKEVIPLSVNES